MKKNKVYKELITPFGDIKEDDNYSYTVARILNDDYCIELHYKNHKATLEYGTRVALDKWENTVENIEWFKPTLTEEYVLERLNTLYDQEFFAIDLTAKQSEELNLLESILHHHKVYDIELYINSNGDLIAYDEENYWYGKDFYEFLFDELFVTNRDGSVDLIDTNDLKKLKEFRIERTNLSNKITLERFKNISHFYQKDIEIFYILKGIYQTFPDICDADCLTVLDFCLKNKDENINIFQLSKYITDQYTLGNISKKELKLLEHKDVNELPFYNNLNHFIPINNDKNIEDYEKDY